MWQEISQHNLFLHFNGLLRLGDWRARTELYLWRLF